MIIALLGALSSGKATIAFYLQKEFGFKICNLVEVFAKDIESELTSEVIQKFFSGK